MQIWDDPLVLFGSGICYAPRFRLVENFLILSVFHDVFFHAIHSYAAISKVS